MDHGLSSPHVTTHMKAFFPEELESESESESVLECSLLTDAQTDWKWPSFLYLWHMAGHCRSCVVEISHTSHRSQV